MRRAFSTPRVAEFASRDGLARLTGYDPALWASVAVKELIDNALDAAEEARVAPNVTVTETRDGGFTVVDDGPGVAPEVVARIVDFDRQTSSRAAYVGPTRGAQGNALQTILAMPYALTQQRAVTVLESRGVRHKIAFDLDPVRLVPAIFHDTEPCGRRQGLKVTVPLPFDDAARAVASEFGLLNPHLTLSAPGVTWPADNPSWTRWTADKPIPAHWHDEASLRRLMSAIATGAAAQREPCPTVAAFVREHYGLAGTGKAKAVCDAASVQRKTREEFTEWRRGAVARGNDRSVASALARKPWVSLAGIPGDVVRGFGRGTGHVPLSARSPCLPGPALPRRSGFRLRTRRVA